MLVAIYRCEGCHAKRVYGNTPEPTSVIIGCEKACKGFTGKMHPGKLNDWGKQVSDWYGLNIPVPTLHRFFRMDIAVRNYLT